MIEPLDWPGHLARKVNDKFGVILIMQKFKCNYNQTPVLVKKEYTHARSSTWVETEVIQINTTLSPLPANDTVAL